MTQHEFRVILSRELAENELDGLAERIYGTSDAPGGDIFPGTTGGVPDAGVYWPGQSFVHAAFEVIGHLEEAAAGLTVTRIESDPIVNQQEIAERMGLTRESIRLAINGKVRQGGFPVPVTAPSASRRMWRWSEVAAWYGVNDPVMWEAMRAARAVNAWLDLRELAPAAAPTPAVLIKALLGEREAA
ncbi:helix-turn-helix transcriptional regulator [Rhizohabitans arisaemae]|uniref:helix-turn-helix transcriptional regulator n=1 Tax=Rhizohabitans arisaemae TaxID=2720610 RepID=UPI0024B1DBBF|nr:hypothetical protein [Rhizohabitans arisaemae]